jgi:uncharacterized protein YjlB
MVTRSEFGSMTRETADLTGCRPKVHRFADDGRIPNSRLPLLLYRHLAVPAEPDAATALERLFGANGWRGAWRDGIYPFHHFHSTSHEVLGVAQGSARVRLGGPGGIAAELGAGDVVVIPAGVGHMCEDASPDFLVVGAYPDGRAWDIRRGNPDERATVLANLAQVPLPPADPVFGAHGPLNRHWRQVPSG